MLGVLINIPVIEISSVNATLLASSIPNRIFKRFLRRPIFLLSAIAYTRLND